MICLLSFPSQSSHASIRGAALQIYQSNKIEDEPICDYFPWTEMKTAAIQRTEGSAFSLGLVITPESFAFLNAAVSWWWQWFADCRPHFDLPPPSHQAPEEAVLVAWQIWWVVDGVCGWAACQPSSCAGKSSHAKVSSGKAGNPFASHSFI